MKLQQAVLKLKPEPAAISASVGILLEVPEQDREQDFPIVSRVIEDVMRFALEWFVTGEFHLLRETRERVAAVVREKAPPAYQEGFFAEADGTTAAYVVARLTIILEMTSVYLSTEADANALAALAWGREVNRLALLAHLAESPRPLSVENIAQNRLYDVPSEGESYKEAIRKALGWLEEHHLVRRGATSPRSSVWIVLPAGRLAADRLAPMLQQATRQRDENKFLQKQLARIKSENQELKGLNMRLAHDLKKKKNSPSDRAAKKPEKTTARRAGSLG